MSETPNPTPSLPRWLPGAVVVLLAGQLGLLWLQGLQLNRQHRDLSATREEMQGLEESLDQSAGGADGTEQEGFAPARHRHGRPGRFLRVRQDPPKPEGEADPAMKDAQKELKASVDSAKKAAADARDIRSKLSLEENARKAEEKAKMNQAQSAWEKWALVAAGVIVVAFLLRGWLRSRES